MPEGGYSSTQVCSITRVPYGTLFEWMSTGLITPSLVKPRGRGKVRDHRGVREYLNASQATRGQAVGP